MENQQVGIVRSDRYKKNTKTQTSSFIKNISRYGDRTRTGTVDNVGGGFVTRGGGTTPPKTDTDVEPPKNSGLVGVDTETAKAMAETAELIDSQIEKYKDLIAENDSPDAREKLVFWQHTKAMEARITGRLEKYGIQDDHFSKNEFKNAYARRAFRLENKAKQPLLADNAAKFYVNTSRDDAVLTQLATGATKEKLDANMPLIEKYSDLIGEYKAKAREHTLAIRQLKVDFHNADPADRKEIGDKLAETQRLRSIDLDIHRALYTGGHIFGGRSVAYNLAEEGALKREAHEEYIKKAIELKGDLDASSIT